MPKNPLEELLRLGSIRKSRSKGNIFQRRAKKAARKYSIPKGFSFAKVRTSKV
jgi:hypothetical protein